MISCFPSSDSFCTETHGWELSWCWAGLLNLMYSRWRWNLTPVISTLPVRVRLVGSELFFWFISKTLVSCWSSWENHMIIGFQSYWLWFPSHNANTSGCIFYWWGMMNFVVMTELTLTKRTPVWLYTCFSSNGDEYEVPLLHPNLYQRTHWWQQNFSLWRWNRVFPCVMLTGGFKS